MSIIGNTKYKFFHIGGPQIARRVWRDYGTMDAVVYIVNADAIISARGRTEELNAELREQFAGPRKDLIDLRSDEAFAEAPFLIFGLRFLEGNSPSVFAFGKLEVDVTASASFTWLFINTNTRAQIL
nr:gtp-binding protein sar2 [Quercus suber]